MFLATLLYPQLRALPQPQRAPLLRRARRQPFDVLELLGMAAVLVGAATLADAKTPATAFPALAFMVPFFVRRTRRGVRSLLGGP